DQVVGVVGVFDAADRRVAVAVSIVGAATEVVVHVAVVLGHVGEQVAGGAGREDDVLPQNMGTDAVGCRRGAFPTARHGVSVCRVVGVGEEHLLAVDLDDVDRQMGSVSNAHTERVGAASAAVGERCL